MLPYPSENPENDLQFRLQLTNFLDELKVRHVDALAKLRENNCVYKIVSHGNGHPNATMNKSYAETLFEFIRDNNYLKKE